MSVNLQFEIGHRASRKTKPSKGGFTHDWELFVRGVGSNDISNFVEKVVFNLHDSFPKPKRVVKEPPYTVKEAGYAGFLLTIDIYLKNRDEPKKTTFSYDLDLTPIKVQLNEIFVPSPSEEFRKKCLRGGGILVSGNDAKNRESYAKNLPVPPMNELKKPAKRPDEVKPNKVFTELFGVPIPAPKKTDSRALQNSSPIPTKLQPPTSGKGVEKIPSTLVSSKEKSEKSKHKHSPNKDGKDNKRSGEVKADSDKPKKDKTKDRERSDKKEKASKRPSSPSPSSMPGSTSSARNSTNLNSLPVAKNETAKSQSKQSSTPVISSEPMSKKNSKKEKKSHEKDRERSEKKESRKETISKEKYELQPPKGISGGGVKERDSNVGKDERDKSKTKPIVSASVEPKTAQMDMTKKQHDKESERKHKHKKKEKTKDKDVVKEVKKEKQHKNTSNAPPPVKAKEPPIVKYEAPMSSHLSDKDSSDSDVDSPPSIKQDSDSNSISDPIVHKAPPEVEKTQKRPRDRTKAADKEDSKSRKRKSSKKDDRETSVSPPPSKMSRKDVSKSPSIHDRPSSSDSAAHQSHTNNNNIEGTASDRKISNEYMSVLKDLKQKITTLKNNEDLQSVVKLIASTGCYEITKSSFDFDLVQLDRATVQRLKEFFDST